MLGIIRIHFTWVYLNTFYTIIRIIRILNEFYLQQTIMWLVTFRVRRITELIPPLWINHRPNPWVLSLRWYVNVFLQTSIWETITVRETKSPTRTCSVSYHQSWEKNNTAHNILHVHGVGFLQGFLKSSWCFVWVWPISVHLRHW